MPLTRSQKPTREWPLLILALALVGAVCIPLWQWSSGSNLAWIEATPERLGRLLLGPEQIACYLGFVWAGLILLGRYKEVLRQQRAFGLGLLPTEESVRILPEDARPLIRKQEQQTRGSPYILANMIRLALNKYAASRSSPDVTETIRTQAEVDQGRLAATMATVHYLAWAIPALGFVGTVRGLAAGLTMTQHADADLQPFIDSVSRQLTFAFDTTFVALVLSLVLMFFLHLVQRDEEALVIDCQQYCLEHLVNRLYDPAGPASPPAEEEWRASSTMRVVR